MSRIDGDVSRLSNSHLNAAKLIASRGILVNADELPSILANVSGDISKLNNQALEELIDLAKKVTINVDEYARISAITSGNNLARITSDQYQALKRELGDLTQRTDDVLTYGIKGVQNSLNWKFIDGDIPRLLENVKIHVMEGEINSRGKLVGGHSARTVKQKWGSDITIIETTPRNAAGVYEVTLEYKTAGMTTPLIKPRSTMFPDDWDWARIKEEVEHAVRYNMGLSPNRLPGETNRFQGLSKDGKIKIDFYFNPGSTNPISSYFPVL